MSETLAQHHAGQGAALAADGIPQHFGNPAAEYDAALEGCALFDRSHEARLRMDGEDRYALLQRTTTNDVLKLVEGGGAATIFINPTGRVIDRVEVYAGDSHAMLIGGPARADALKGYIQRNIFFRDKVRVGDLTPVTAQMSLHGPQAGAVAEKIAPGAENLPLFGYLSADVAGTQVMIARAKPLSGDHFRVIVGAAQASAVWDALVEAGAVQAGSQIYNVLRIRAGVAGPGRELTSDFIPLELDLWDEVNFAKGCYTGQEIIARMESRGKLAKTLVALRFDAPVEAPSDLLIEGRRAGTLTSAVTAPDGIHYGVGLLKPDFAHEGMSVVTASEVTGRVALSPNRDIIKS